jgi:hypothetical protein
MSRTTKISVIFLIFINFHFSCASQENFVPKLNIGLDIFSLNTSIYGNNMELINNNFKSNLDWRFSILGSLGKKTSISFSNSVMHTQQGKILSGDTVIFLLEQGMKNQISLIFALDTINSSLTNKYSVVPNFGLLLYSFSPYKRGIANGNDVKYNFSGSINEGVLHTKFGWGLQGGFFIQNNKSKRLSSLFLHANFEIPNISPRGSNKLKIYDHFFNFNLSYSWYFKMI